MRSPSRLSHFFSQLCGNNNVRRCYPLKKLVLVSVAQGVVPIITPSDELGSIAVSLGPLNDSK